ncbi:hypothetical protein AB0K48_19620 [Nonomuraea sp. NPDC055795]
MREADGRVHSYCSRTVTAAPVDGRRVLVSVQVRRLVCPARGLRLSKTPSTQVKRRESTHGEPAEPISPTYVLVAELLPIRDRIRGGA